MVEPTDIPVYELVRNILIIYNSTVYTHDINFHPSDALPSV